MSRVYSNFLAILISLGMISTIEAGVVTFTDIDAFRAAAEPLVEIDFSTLPDGSQAIPGAFVDITAEFNYSDWGVTFLSPDPELKLIRDFDGSTLLATGPSGTHMWIEAGFEPMVYAVGFTDGAVFGPFLSIFDENDLLLAETRSLNGFVGMISDEPIDFALIDEHTEGVAISSILFQPVPEPLTIFLLGGGALFAARRR